MDESSPMQVVAVGFLTMLLFSLRLFMIVAFNRHILRCQSLFCGLEAEQTWNWQPKNFALFSVYQKHPLPFLHGREFPNKTPHTTHLMSSLDPRSDIPDGSTRAPELPEVVGGKS